MCSRVAVLTVGRLFCFRICSVGQPRRCSPAHLPTPLLGPRHAQVCARPSSLRASRKRSRFSKVSVCRSTAPSRLTPCPHLTATPLHRRQHQFLCPRATIITFISPATLASAPPHFLLAIRSTSLGPPFFPLCLFVCLSVSVSLSLNLCVRHLQAVHTGPD